MRPRWSRAQRRRYGGPREVLPVHGQRHPQQLEQLRQSQREVRSRSAHHRTDPLKGPVRVRPGIRFGLTGRYPKDAGYSGPNRPSSIALICNARYFELIRHWPIPPAMNHTPC